MLNNASKNRAVSMMARDKSLDDVWDEIFDSLVLDNEPPFEYIKNVVITTKAGLRLKVNPIDFAHILERERYLTPEESEILSCKLAINFTKVRKDVDTWADHVMSYFDNRQQVSETKARKPATAKKPAAKKAPTKKPAAKKPAAKKPATKKLATKAIKGSTRKSK